MAGLTKKRKKPPLSDPGKGRHERERERVSRERSVPPGGPRGTREKTFYRGGSTSSPSPGITPTGTAGGIGAAGAAMAIPAPGATWPVCRA